MIKREPAPEHPWSVPLALHEVPETGRHLELAADGQACAAIAELAGLRALPRLHAVFDVTRHGGDGLRVTGRVSARVGQTCVVTLEPIESEIDEPVDLLFVPPSGALAHHPANREPIRRRKSDRAGKAATPAGATPGAGDAGTGGEADDARQTLIGGVVDLGALATEYLILGIDPYPRKPDAVFEGVSAGEPAANPFAVLAALKQGPGGKPG